MSQSTEHAGGAAACANCERPLTGRYCAHCGQEALGAEALTVKHFVAHTLVEEIGHLDAKLWRTVRDLVFRPGLLAAEYAEGRRRRYIGPVKLFVAAVVAYALLTQGGLRSSLDINGVKLSTAPAAIPEGISVAETVGRIDRFGLLARVLNAKGPPARLESEAVRDRFHRRLEQFAEPLAFANVALLSVALFALFRGTRRLYVTHAVFSLHLVSFVLLSSLLLLPVLALASSRAGQGLGRGVVFVGLWGLAISLWQFVYVALSIRRFYLGGARSSLGAGAVSLAAAVLVYAVNSVFITSVQLLGGVIALWSV